MAIVARRVFHGKPGSAEELLKVLREGIELFEKRGYSPASFRLLTDYVSGRSDRVVEEVELESLGQYEAVMGKLMSDPGFQAEVSALQRRIFELVDCSEVEHWSIR